VVHGRVVPEFPIGEAHCKHLGAQIGHGGTVVGDCVECPFHGWRWGPDGTNRYIGLGGAISAFEGASNHRLIFACTPVDDTNSNMFYSIWWPRNPGDHCDIPPEKLRGRVEQQHLSTVWDELNIWRYQHYVEHPALSEVDAKSYMALRKWATQFYAVPPTATASA
jgi:3-Ketosteroid 9alpha-hydroxylase C-terminal domain/Rieske [2Fe-2S] domain